MRMILMFALIVWFPIASLAADVPKDDAKFVNLFDGKSLAGWKVEKCEVEVQDGCILLKAGNGWMHAEKEYGDFVLELEWKALKKSRYDSGIYIRAAPAGAAPWPKRNQVNLREDLLGNMPDYRGAAARLDLVKPGEWNHFRLDVLGASAELRINGRQAWKIDGLTPASGLIGLQCEVPGGGQFLIRNVRIQER